MFHHKIICSFDSAIIAVDIENVEDIAIVEQPIDDGGKQIVFARVVLDKNPDSLENENRRIAYEITRQLDQKTVLVHFSLTVEYGFDLGIYSKYYTNRQEYGPNDLKRYSLE